MIPETFKIPVGFLYIRFRLPNHFWGYKHLPFGADFDGVISNTGLIRLLKTGHFE